ncbi:hypothetical protein BU25DRAFT_449472 [Macroventuria anomochaeta]|uniref:Uncharacterized protein n=1 Tax=Macroventuria anomochaeta TaxID=301207 RepID=A0ACB6RXI0_9PLEO|nr:uncharacterized protein BU25DRAFT_449472 [Macroventuria anomochaeta]KAF2626125.1 hypothetical protein BU25DRAFT_449472 [Macroventuria anomochaeta]
MSGTAFNSPQLDMSDSASCPLGLAPDAKQRPGCETRRGMANYLVLQCGWPSPSSDCERTVPPNPVDAFLKQLGLSSPARRAAKACWHSLYGEKVHTTILVGCCARTPLRPLKLEMRLHTPTPYSSAADWHCSASLPPRETTVTTSSLCPAVLNLFPKCVPASATWRGSPPPTAGYYCAAWCFGALCLHAPASHFVGLAVARPFMLHQARRRPVNVSKHAGKRQATSPCTSLQGCRQRLFLVELYPHDMQSYCVFAS